MFVLEGLRICLDALENSISFYAVIFTKEFFSKNKDFCEKLSNNALNTVITNENLFAKISETVSPQGVIAVANIPTASVDFKESGRFVALENINDPANLGAIARTSEALGIDGIIVTSDTADPYSPKALRASMGTLIRMPIYICNDLSDFILEHNLRSFACVVNSDAENIADIKFADGDVIIIGNEANGITDKTKNKAYKKITIKMKGNAESLNAAAAASIAIFSLTK